MLSSKESKKIIIYSNKTTGRKMKTYYECLPCFSRQALTTLKYIEPELREKVMRDVMHMLGDLDYSLTPPFIAGEIYKIINKYTEISDYYAADKAASNEHVLEIFDELKGDIAKSGKPFVTAVKFAIAGNIIDFGAKHDFTIESIHDELSQALSMELDEASILELKEAVDNAEKILYLGDNAGEIVFDRLLVEQLPKDKVIFAVRGKPIINDALLEDAEKAGLTRIVKVIENGSSLPGTCLELCSDEFIQVFNEADLVISKGQGNYETLNEVDKNIFFLLKIKCNVVAGQLNGKIGDCICLHKK